MFFKRDIPSKTLFRLSVAAFCLGLVVVILGAFTRLADAGLGCPDWPGCYGHLLWPNEAHEITQAEMRFPDAPVETDKTWPEMVHRYFAGTLGLLVLAIAVVTIREQKKSDSLHLPVKLSLFICAFILLQAAFGMWTVTLKLWPKVVTAHLLGGFTMLALLWLMVQRLGGQQWMLNDKSKQKLSALLPLCWMTMIIVITQIALGGWVSSNYAALACPDFPQCLGQWTPPADFNTGFNVWQSIGPNYLGGQLDNEARTAIHLAHRMGAIVVTLFVLLTAFRLIRIGEAAITPWAYCLIAVLLIQITLGISNVIFQLPLPIAVAHNAVGALLLLTTVTIVYRAQSALRSIREGQLVYAS